MKLLRLIAFGLLLALGVYLLGLVLTRLGGEFYPWAYPVFEALLPGIAGTALVLGGWYGYKARSRATRNWILGLALIAAFSGFFMVAIQVIDDHHSQVLSEQKDRWRSWVWILRKKNTPVDICQKLLLEERLAAKGHLDPKDVAATELYCSTWGQSLQTVRYPMHQFWTTFDEQGGYPFRRGNQDI